MEFLEAKDKFIQTWGALGTSWGVNKSMTQVHALLLIYPEPICADQIRDELQISQGSANTNIHKLIDWGLAYKVCKCGDRKDYFTAEKDIWKACKQIMINRRKRELEPILRMLDELSTVDPKCPHSEEFVQMVDDIKKISYRVDSALEKLQKTERNWLLKKFINPIR